MLETVSLFIVCYLMAICKGKDLKQLRELERANRPNCFCKVVKVFYVYGNGKLQQRQLGWVYLVLNVGLT